MENRTKIALIASCVAALTFGCGGGGEDESRTPDAASGDAANAEGSGGIGGGTGGTLAAGGGSSDASAAGGNATGGGSTGGGSDAAGSGTCEAGTSATEWATSCPAPQRNCTPGTWTARPQGSDGHPLQAESDHFAVYWYTSDPDGTGPLRGVANPPSTQTVQTALDTLEMIWSRYFGSPMYFPEPYCNSTTKTKAAVHFDDFYPLWGGGWGSGYMGLWIGPSSATDDWGLAHEFMHGVQSTTPAFPDCDGVGCWIFESHANWSPHQVWPDDPHYCSDMLPNMPHLYYGSTRDRYCNWQFFEFLKDKHCHAAVNDMWAYDAPSGQGDPWQKLMLSRGWSIEGLNDFFGEWALHNITWDYQDPPPGSGTDKRALYRQAWGSLENPGGWSERRLRLTRLEPLSESWPQDRRFMSPYYWAPQRWGYNVVRLYPEANATSVRVTFRGVIQDGANSGWRWALVATDSNLTTSRYSPLQAAATGELDFCVNAGENLYLVVVATPTAYQKLVWTNPSDGPAYPSIYRYPYLVQVDGAWPAGFQNGQLEACPEGTVRHANGGGCATEGTPATVYVGPYAQVLGGTVSGSARIEDQATILNGTVSGGTIGGLSLIGVAGRAGRGPSSFNVSGTARVHTTFYPLGWFGEDQSVSNAAQLIGDVEFVASSKTSNAFYGLVSNDWDGVSSLSDVTIAPPYSWEP